MTATAPIRPITLTRREQATALYRADCLLAYAAAVRRRGRGVETSRFVRLALVEIARVVRARLYEQEFRQ